MPDKYRGDVEFVYEKGYFSSVQSACSIQLYQLYEREVTTKKNLQSPISKEGFLLLFCMTGEGTLNIGDVAVPFVQNSLLIASADKEYTIEPSAQAKSLRYICLNLSMDMIPMISIDPSLYFYFMHNENPIIVHDAYSVKQCLSLMIAELCAAKASAWLVSGFLDQMLVDIYRTLVTVNGNSVSNEPTVTAVGHTVYAVIRYIDENLYSMTNLMSMAKELGYSYNYLSHLFRKKTGVTIQAYVSQKKIERSTKLLAEEKYSITEIAAMLNYDCIQSFSKAFRKSMKMSPTEYRASYGIIE